VRLLQFLVQIVPQFRAPVLNFGSHASDDSFVGDPVLQPACTSIVKIKEDKRISIQPIYSEKKESIHG